jgi:hypothetical protein
MSDLDDLRDMELWCLQRAGAERRMPGSGRDKRHGAGSRSRSHCRRLSETETDDRWPDANGAKPYYWATPAVLIPLKNERRTVRRSAGAPTNTKREGSAMEDDCRRLSTLMRAAWRLLSR